MPSSIPEIQERNFFSLLRDKRGSFPAIMAFVGIGLVSAVGLTIDYTRLIHAQKSMQQVLDAATLAAVHESSIEKAKIVFDRYTAGHFESGAKLRSFKPEIVSYNGDLLVAKALGEVEMTFPAVLGFETMGVSANSEATHARSHQELIFAIDLSSSLGMASTPEGRKKLGEISYPYTRTAWYGENLPNGCAFGCHRREGWEPDGKTMYDIAKENDIVLREDELLTQFGGLVDLLLDPADPNVAQGKRKVSVMAFANWTKDLIIRSTSASAVKAALDDFPKPDRFETYFSKAFSRINTLLGTQGSGSSTDPKKMVVMITDGIESRDAFFAQRPIDESLCTTLKNKGFDLAIVELKYPKLLNDYLYRDTVEPVENDISPAMERCASPGWYFRVVDDADIPARFNDLKEKFGVKNVRLVK